MANSAKIVETARISFEKGMTKPLEWRIKQLQGLRSFLIDEEDALCKAVYSDLRKSKQEFLMTESILSKNEIHDALKNIYKWTGPTYVSKTALQMLDSVYVHKEPLGVVLIIGSWNYPILLIIQPLIAAIAAGNCAVIKPSEVSENTSKALAALLPRYLDKECFPVYTGGVSETTELLKQKFDHIFFTGSNYVGKIIMTAAAKHLTPVTLELGGKSPVYVDDNIYVNLVARRLVWGKLINCGQTCVGPDYVLCHKDVKDELIRAMKSAITEMVGENAIESADYGRLVSDKQTKRLAEIMDRMPKEKLVCGGDVNVSSRFIAPTVYHNVSMDDSVMECELFGPILPVITVSHYKEAIKIIKSKEKALTMYIFSNTNSVVDEVLSETSTGSVCVNDTLLQMSTNLPFGGVGNSGFGRYHGKCGFDTFSNERSICWRRQNMESALSMRYMPFSESKLKMVKRLTEQDGIVRFCSIM